MSHFRLRQRSAAAAPTVLYDNRYGTDTTTAASTGWFTFDLRPGCRRVWVNSSGGNDANDGLSAANAKATWNAAMTVLKASFTAGDQLMAAGTGGRFYTDTHNDGMTSYPGFSAAYPVAFLSYDPADAANSAKYGKLTGADMPIVKLDPAGAGSNQPSMAIAGGGAGSYLAVQGFELDGQGGSLVSLDYTGAHSHIIHQNCRLKGVGISRNATPGGGASGGNISKCSFWGLSNGGTYFELIDGAWMQDIIFAHVGWDLTATRATAPGSGGPSQFKHNTYYHASCVNGRFDRIFSADASNEALGMRGGALATSIVSLDNPVGVIAGAFSTALSEAPLGVMIQIDDVLFAGGDNLSTNLGLPGGQLLSTQNTQSGSYCKNVVAFDNPLYNSSPGQDRQVEVNASFSGMINQYMLCDLWSSYLAAATLQSINGVDLTKVHLRWTNSALDQTAVSYNDTAASGCSVYSSAPAGYKTRAQFLAALGSRYSSGTYAQQKAALVNDMLYRPDLNWAAGLLAVGMPTMGRTPTKTSASAAMPDMSAITPPAIY